MKKIITTAFLLALGINVGNAQNGLNAKGDDYQLGDMNIKKTSSDDDGIASKGNNIVNVSYGVNLLTAFIKNAATNSQSTDISVKSFGPIGLVYEHLVVDKIGLGVEFGYGSTTINYKEAHDVYDNNGNTVGTAYYNYKYKVSTIRAQIRANFHFINNEKFDAYFLLSAGYRGTTFTYTTDQPNAGAGSLSGIIPFGLKPGVGFRYFFTKNIARSLLFSFCYLFISKENQRS